MKTIHPGLAAHLAGGITTLARCWTLRRRDGVVMGFTDHDLDLMLDGVPHRARSGLDAAEAASELGLAVASTDVRGVLTEAGITEADIASGLYDGAEVTVHLVDWSDPANRQRLDVMTIGEITRSDVAFVAELRSAAHRFDEERGRLYTMRCGADLGDSRCGKAIAPLRGTVLAATGRGDLLVSAASAPASGWFEGGCLAFVTGANAGHAVEIGSHRQDGDAAALGLWLEAPHAVSPGDEVDLTPGCDKSFATCRTKFDNAVNFQGFPHIPGTDFLLQVASEGARQRFDGASLFR